MAQVDWAAYDPIFFAHPGANPPASILDESLQTAAGPPNASEPAQARFGLADPG